MSSSEEKKDDEITKRFEVRSKAMIGRWAGVKNEEKRTVISDHGKVVEPYFVQRHLGASARIQTISGHLGCIEPAREIPVKLTCEVLVCGGGPAGLSAAITAARAGADVLLVERYGCFGGVITTVGMETLGWYRYPGTVQESNIGIEMEKLAAKMGGSVKFPYNDSECLDADFFKIVADHLIRENKIRPLLHTMVVEVIMEGKTITGVIVESKGSGRYAIRANRIIDCTGDADVAYLAGAQCRKYEKSDMMGVTTVFSTAGVNKQSFLSYVTSNPSTYKDWSREWHQYTTGKENHLLSPYLDEQFVRAEKEGIIPPQAPDVSIGGTWSALTDAGEATNLNLVHMKNIDATDVEDITKAEMEGRRQVLNAVKALKHTVPGFENAKLRNISMTLGIRDTRKIVGRYELTDHDVRNEARFKDSIGIFPEFIDGYAILVLPTTGRYFQVPYGCLVPYEIDNLLVGGRCVAGDRTSHAAMRNMMACCVTGSGCGAAAAVSLRTGQSTQNVDIVKVQKELERQGTRVF
jgi:ribulose 1,5-bisphosphate synthetase/thiazole synthase